MIYLDYQATTPLAPEARAAMMPLLDAQFANPHSPHRMGREAAAAVEVAREEIDSLFVAGGRIAFTSGATEALNWAIKGTTGAIVTFATEHAAVLDTVAAVGRARREVTIIPVGRDGLINLDAARSAIGPGTGMVAAMLVNNEIGVIQPIAALAEFAHAAGALFLCDAVQGYGRATIPAACDLVAISAHKIHGPKGIGALWVRDGVTIEPLLHGGNQEAPGRSGTLAPALCAGFGAAARLMREREYQDSLHLDALWDRALERLGPEWKLNGAANPRYHGNLNIRADGIDANRLISEVRDVAFSAGSACASGSGRASHVLKALGLTDAQARSSIRLGFGRYTTMDELDRALASIRAAADRQREWAA